MFDEPTSERLCHSCLRMLAGAAAIAADDLRAAGNRSGKTRSVFSELTGLDLDETMDWLFARICRAALRAKEGE